MQLPAIYYGTSKEVEKSCRKLVTALKRGSTWPKVVGPLVNLSDKPGATLVFDGPSDVLDPQRHFHCYYPARLLMESVDKLPDDVEEHVFSNSLASAWGVLTFLSRNASFVLTSRHAARYKRFLDAVIIHWAELTEVGPIYRPGTLRLEPIYQWATNIQFVLVRLGVSPEHLRPFPPEGPAVFLDIVEKARRYEIEDRLAHLHGGLSDRLWSSSERQLRGAALAAVLDAQNEPGWRASKSTGPSKRYVAERTATRRSRVRSTGYGKPSMPRRKS